MQANPLLAFEKILAVRSSAENNVTMGVNELYAKDGSIVRISNGTRYPRNWKTRASCGSHHKRVK